MDILYYQFPESFKYVKILQEKTGLLEEKNIITDKLKKTLENEEHIFDLYNESHAIFLTENIANEKIFFKDFLRKKSEPLDLPFKTVWFEHLDNKNICQMKNGLTRLPYSSILVNEISPNNYEFLVNNMDEDQDINFKNQFGGFGLNRKTALYFSTSAIFITKEDHGYGECMAILKNILNTIDKDDLGTIKIHKKHKFKRNGKNHLKKINNIVICGKKQNIEKMANQHFQREIDWSHQWEVRGHWRKCIGIGKNRDGLYCISYHTWVKNHKKGIGPLVKKERVFINESNQP